MAVFLPQNPMFAPPFPPWKSRNPFSRTMIPIPQFRTPKSFSIQSLFQQNPKLSRRRSVMSFAGRNKKKASRGSNSKESLLEMRERLNRYARKEDQKLLDGFYRRIKDPHSNYPDNFTESELESIGLGYDRYVRFMKKDDPNLKHPYDWYKYGEYGPYNWRGVVLGDPIRGGITDECVTLISSVKNQDEWERIEQHEMSVDFAEELKKLDPKLGLKRFWVFVRHPRWRLSDLPWQQWTLVCEVVVESRNQRLDKWSLMGRFSNHIRALITECAAWMRPDILYVKRPIYQCRFEPQVDFFKTMIPFLDPETEKDFMFELEVEDGRVEPCTYFGGLCRLARVNPKAFVDDVVNAYDKLGDEKKNKCLEFLLTNHPIPLLHPYTMEWKVKLEEMELGCDAPEEDEEDHTSDTQQNSDQIEEDDDNFIVEDLDDEELGFQENEEEEEEELPDMKQWEDEMKKAMKSTEGMENLLKRSVEMSEKIVEREKNKKREYGDGDEMEMRGPGAKIPRDEWKRAGIGRGGKRIPKTRMPPGLALNAAVRPFTYKNLVKEIVLIRHAIVEGEIGPLNSTNSNKH